MKATLCKTSKTLGLALVSVMTLGAFKAQAYQDGVLPYSPFMGMFYKEKGDKRCPDAFEIFIKRDLFWDRLVGLSDAFGIGYDPKLEFINAKPVISDAGSVGGRNTTFIMTNNTYKVTDTFAGYAPQTVELRKTLVRPSTESVDVYVTKTMLTPGTFTCNYIRFTYQL